MPTLPLYRPLVILGMWWWLRPGFALIHSGCRYALRNVISWDLTVKQSSVASCQKRSQGNPIKRQL